VTKPVKKRTVGATAKALPARVNSHEGTGTAPSQHTSPRKGRKLPFGNKDEIVEPPPKEEVAPPPQQESPPAAETAAETIQKEQSAEKGKVAEEVKPAVRKVKKGLSKHKSKEKEEDPSPEPKPLKRPSPRKSPGAASKKKVGKLHAKLGASMPNMKFVHKPETKKHVEDSAVAVSAETKNGTKTEPPPEKAAPFQGSSLRKVIHPPMDHTETNQNNDATKAPTHKFAHKNKSTSAPAKEEPTEKSSKNVESPPTATTTRAAPVSKLGLKEVVPVESSKEEPKISTFPFSKFGRKHAQNESAPSDEEKSHPEKRSSFLPKKGDDLNHENHHPHPHHHHHHHLHDALIQNQAQEIATLKQEKADLEAKLQQAKKDVGKLEIKLNTLKMVLDQDLQQEDGLWNVWV
jgi:hypothetical protein